jgi:hypothetical protein
MKTAPKTRPGNVTPFVLEGCWALDSLDQQTMRSLSKEAKRKRVGSPMSSTKLSSHSSRNAKLRPNSKRKLSSFAAADAGNVVETHKHEGDFREA